jgi:LacI family transcriptional regulator
MPTHDTPRQSNAVVAQGAASGVAPVTMKDVAQRAGVSIATVSLVVNGKTAARIGEGTRQRVEQAINELGYRTNAAGRSLVNGRSTFIGLVADAIATTPFAGQIIRGAQQAAWERGYALLVVDTDAVPEVTDTAIQMMSDHRASGILYSTWYHRQVEPPRGLAHIPTVFVNCFADLAGSYAVVPDEVQGGRTATSLLLARGHRRIAFINSTEQSPATIGRLQGYREAMREAGVKAAPELIVRTFPEQEGGYRAASRLLSLADPPTAVFCYNDRVAMGLYDKVKEAGLSIPRDIAVMGFDDQEVIAAHLRPALSTIALPHYEIGAVGMRTLLDRLDDEATGDAGVRRIPCPPVLRASI